MNTKKLVMSVKDPQNGERTIVRLIIEGVKDQTYQVLLDKNLTPELGDLIAVKFEQHYKHKKRIDIFEYMKSETFKYFYDFLACISNKYGIDYFNGNLDEKDIFVTIKKVVNCIVDEIINRGESFHTQDVYSVEYPLAILISISDQIGGKNFAESLINILTDKLEKKSNFYKTNEILDYLIAFVDGMRGRLRIKEFERLMYYEKDQKMSFFLDHLIVYGALYKGLDISNMYKGELLDDLEFMNAVMQGKMNEAQSLLSKEFNTHFDPDQMLDSANGLKDLIEKLKLDNRYYREIIRILRMSLQSKSIVSNMSNYGMKNGLYDSRYGLN